MNYRPPFKITTKTIDLISQISLNIGKLEAIDASSTLPMLRKVNQIRTITGTLQIEGSSLDEERITALIEGKRVLGKVDEIAEANGAIALYKQLDNLNFGVEQELLKSHKILMGELLKTAGKYRTRDVGVGGANGVVHVAPSCGQIPKLMGDLLHWLSTTDEHPLIVSSVFHYEFEFIHPFIDGNGRMGRFWQSLILYNWNNYFSVIPIESIIRDK
jgi:Fic family protein